MMIENAKDISFAAHAMQKRKYTDEPYFNHTRNVAYLVEIADGTDEMIAASYLHDVLEDVTPINPFFNEELILAKCGEKVLLYVKLLTDTPAIKGNRATRKQMDCARLFEAPPEVKTIKLADLIDNSLTIVKYDPDFAVRYLREKRNMLGYLQGGNRHLFGLAEDILIKNGY